MAEGDIRDGELRLKDIRDDWGTIGAIRGLPPKVSPMDADGLIELNYHWLLIERDRHGNITDGQRTVLKRFSLLPNCQAWYIPGAKNTFASVRVYRAGVVAERFNLCEAGEEQQWQVIADLFAQFTVEAGRNPRAPELAEQWRQVLKAVS